MLRELRYAGRRAKKNWLSSCATIFIIALGVGVNGALVSVLSAITVRPLIMSDPSRVMAVTRANKRGQTRWMPMTVATALLRDQDVFSSTAGYAGGGTFTTDFDGTLTSSSTEFVTGEYYKLLGAKAAIGRLISSTDSDLSAASSNIAVLGFGYWKRVCGSDPTVLGKAIRVDGHIHDHWCDR